MRFILSLCIFLLAAPVSSATKPAATLRQAPVPVVHSSPERTQALVLYREGKFKEAANLLKKAVKKDKQDAEAWQQLGLSLMKIGEFKDATKAFETVLKLQPNSLAARVALSYALLQRNKLVESLLEARAAIEIDPTILDPHFISGVVHLRRGAREEAEKQADAAIKINPNFAPAYLLKSQALVGFSGAVMIRPDVESPETHKERYIRAADALEKYLQLDLKAENKETWVEQLESLRFHAAFRSGHNDVYSSKDVTTKPRILAKPEPQYTDRARANRVSGTVVFRVLLAADGTVKHIVVITGLPDGLTEASLSAARKIKFIPATLNGRPVSMFVQLEYNFNIF